MSTLEEWCPAIGRWRQSAEREGFEPSEEPGSSLHFECSAINHSATSPFLVVSKLLYKITSKPNAALFFFDYFSVHVVVRLAVDHLFCFRVLKANVSIKINPDPYSVRFYCVLNTFQVCDILLFSDRHRKTCLLRVIHMGFGMVLEPFPVLPKILATVRTNITHARLLSDIPPRSGLPSRQADNRFLLPDTVWEKFVPSFIRIIHERNNFLIGKIAVAVSGENAFGDNTDLFSAAQPFDK